ncbi:hypothetical protein ACWC4J_32920, partial [Streptomyces sp. NPDC001356]
AIKWVGDKFSDFYYLVIAPVLGFIGDAASGLWKNYLSPFFKGFWDSIKQTGDGFVALWDDYIDPAIGYIADGAKWLYDKALKPAFDNIMDAVGLVGDAFESARKSIKSAWS